MAANQEQIEARLAAYIDGELSAAECAEIEKHLAANPQHRKLIEELTGQRDMLLALPREKAPAELFETLQGQLERSVLLGSAADAVDAPRHINRWPHRGAIAAIVLLAAGLAVLVYKVLPSNKPPAEFAVAPKETGPVPATMETDEPKAEVPMAVSAKPGATSDADKIGFAKSAPPAAKGGDGAVAVAPSPVDAQTAPNAAGPSVEPAPSVALRLRLLHRSRHRRRRLRQHLPIRQIPSQRRPCQRRRLHHPIFPSRPLRRPARDRIHRRPPARSPKTRPNHLRTPTVNWRWRRRQLPTRLMSPSNRLPTR